MADMNLLEGKTQSDTTQFIVVRLGEEEYGIDIRFIDNIVRMQHITRVPKVQTYFKGVINLRGEVIPVMSIRLKMGLPEDVVTNASRIIIIKMESGAAVGVIVDEVKEVVTLDASCIEKMGYDAKEEKQNFIRGVGKCNGGLISLLDLGTVIGEKENS